MTEDGSSAGSATKKGGGATMVISQSWGIGGFSGGVVARASLPQAGKRKKGVGSCMSLGERLAFSPPGGKRIASTSL